MEKRKNGFKLVDVLFVIEVLFVITILSILAAVIVPRFRRERAKSEPKMDLTTRSVGQPGIELAKFYLVKGKYWGYDDQYVQFKDAKDDRILDQVALVRIKDFFVFNPDTGYPGDDVFDPNSSNWDEWLKKFDLVLEEHAEKLEQQRLMRQER